MYEMLCRGTAFSVKSDTGRAHLMTCSHIVAPWRWPKLYPLPWLKFVNEKHTLIVLHLTEVGKSSCLQGVSKRRPAHNSISWCGVNINATLTDVHRALVEEDSPG
jgi:hypothetical protein